MLLLNRVQAPRGVGLRTSTRIPAAAPCKAPVRRVVAARALGEGKDGHEEADHNTQPRMQDGEVQHPERPMGSEDEPLLYPPAHWSQEYNRSTRPMHPDDNWDTKSWDLASTDDIPSPANTPTNEDVDFRIPNTPMELTRGMRMGTIWHLTESPGIDLLTAGPSLYAAIPQVYVILFGVGERDTEGIYSLRALAEETGLPQDTIIVFESEEDATRYAGLLEATMDHAPNVCSIPPHELLDFCVDHGYACRMEPAGSLLIPPDFNVGVTDWERSMRLRDGRWAVLEAEPQDPSSSASGPLGSTLTVAPSSVKQQQAPSRGSGGSSPYPGMPGPGFGGAGNGPQVPPGQQQQFQGGGPGLARYLPSTNDAQLNLIRAQLEALLPPDSA